MSNFVIPNAKGPVIRDSDIEDDADDLYTVIGYDPGGTTGWAAIGVYKEAIEEPSEYKILDNIAFWTAGQFIGSEVNQVNEMLSLADSWPGARLVCEDFVLRKFSSARELLAPVRITARFLDRLEWKRGGRPVIFQQPSLAMGTVTDARLKKMGFWPPLAGQEHARDGFRHAFTWLRRARKLQNVKQMGDKE